MRIARFVAAQVVVVLFLLGVVLAPQGTYGSSWTGWAWYYATGYDLGGTTATGSGTYYGVIAVDPNVIPLGSTVQVRHVGTFRALDTGGDIVGARVDIWEPTLARCLALTGWYQVRWRR